MKKLMLWVRKEPGYIAGIGWVWIRVKAHSKPGAVQQLLKEGFLISLKEFLKKYVPIKSQYDFFPSNTEGVWVKKVGTGSDPLKPDSWDRLPFNPWARDCSEGVSRNSDCVSGRGAVPEDPQEIVIVSVEGETGNQIMMEGANPADGIVRVIEATKQIEEL